MPVYRVRTIKVIREDFLVEASKAEYAADSVVMKDHDTRLVYTGTVDDMILDVVLEDEYAKYRTHT